MKVWVVEHGEYSDRHVVAVTDSEHSAEQIANWDSSGSARAYELNEIADRLLQGYRSWQLTFGEDGQCREAVEDYNSYDLDLEEPCWTSYPNAPSFSTPVLEIHVAARDKVEAIKIGSERRRVFLATQVTRA